VVGFEDESRGEREGSTRNEVGEKGPYWEPKRTLGTGRGGMAAFDRKRKSSNKRVRANGAPKQSGAPHDRARANRGAFITKTRPGCQR